MTLCLYVVPFLRYSNRDIHTYNGRYRKSCMIYRTAPFSMTLNDPYPQFQGHVILWRWISHKRYTWFQWNTNMDIHTPYSIVSFRMTLSDLKWLQNIQWHEASRGLSATAELLVFTWNAICRLLKLHIVMLLGRRELRCVQVFISSIVTVTWR